MPRKTEKKRSFSYNLLNAECTWMHAHPVHLCWQCMTLVQDECRSWTHQQVQEPETTLFYPTNDPESQILDVRITQNKRNAGETSVVQSDGWFWFWVYVPESRACRSSAGPLEDGAARYRDSLFRPAEPTEAEEEEERTSADRTDVSLKTRQTDVDIMLHRWCKVCCCCSRLLMFS